MTELVIICINCGKTGSLARLDDCTIRTTRKIEQNHYDCLKYENAYLCWNNGTRDWWEVETKTVVGTCPKCLNFLNENNIDYEIVPKMELNERVDFVMKRL